MSNHKNQQFVVEFEDVTFRYHTKPIFTSLSFQIPSNSCTLLLGPTGIGKTTILRMIKGIIPYFLPYLLTGRISVFSEVKTEHNYLEQNLDIGYLFQDTEMQFIGSTVEQDLAFGLENMGIPSHKIKAHIEHLGYHFPIMQNLKHRTPYSLSGGELTLVEFLATLIMQPKLLLCDEPIAHLDSFASQQFLAFLEKYLKNYSCIISTHSIEPFLPLANYIVALNPSSGQLAYQGNVKDFLDRINEFFWLEQPLISYYPDL